MTEKALDWWSKILEQKTGLEKNLSDSDLSLQEQIAIQKKLAGLEEAIELAERAEEIKISVEFLQHELQEAAEDEAIELQRQMQEYEDNLRQLGFEFQELQTRRSQESSKLILEIRPGVGGQEASLFASMLLEMYRCYSTDNNWNWEVLSLEFNEAGGLTLACISIEGRDALYLMQHESGVHRVQRVPTTESCGRIHTSTSTVAVLMEPEESEVEIDQRYLRTEFFRAGGAGGQHVNKTESAVRLTYAHPDLQKIVISIQDEKSQHKNKSKAMKLLRARVAEELESRINREASEKRRLQVGKADRSEKIRTYNILQDRVTDHRSNESVHCIDKNRLLGGEHLRSLTEPLRLQEARGLIEND